MRRQCALVGVARSRVYRPKPVAEADDLAVMRRIDELHLELPFYGSRRMTFELNTEGPGGQPQAGAAADAGDGDRGAGSAPRHEQSRARAQDSPYLLRGLKIVEAEPPMGGRCDLHPDGVRLPSIWWRSSTGPAGRFWHGGCRTPTMRASARRRWRRRCFGSESREFFSIPIRAPLSPPRLSPASLVTAGVVISMDGHGRFMDNIFIERLWRSIKYEEVHLKAYADGCEARSGISSWMNFYNFQPSPADKQPDADGGVARRHGQKRVGGEGCGKASSLAQLKRDAHKPTPESATTSLILEGQRQARLHLKFNDPWSLEWGPVHTEGPSSALRGSLWTYFGRTIAEAI